MGASVSQTPMSPQLGRHGLRVLAAVFITAGIYIVYQIKDVKKFNRLSPVQNLRYVQRDLS